MEKLGFPIYTHGTEFFRVQLRKDFPPLFPKFSHGVYSVIDLVKSNADRGIRGFRGFRGLSESGGLLVVFLPCLVEASLGGLSLDEV